MVKLSLSMPWRYMGGTEVQLHSFLDQWSTSRPGSFTSYPLYRWLGGPNSNFRKEKIFFSCGDSEHHSYSCVTHIAIRNTTRTAASRILLFGTPLVQLRHVYCYSEHNSYSCVTYIAVRNTTRTAASRILLFGTPLVQLRHVYCYSEPHS